MNGLFRLWIDRDLILKIVCSTTFGGNMEREIHT